MSTPAAMITNTDDDDLDNNEDCIDSTINGWDDLNDIAKLIIRKTPIQVDSAVLSILPDDDEHVQVFANLFPGETAVLGGTSGTSHSINTNDLASQDLHYGIESLWFSSDASPSIVITLTITHNSIQYVDQVSVVPAPYLLLPNTSPAEKIYVSERYPDFVSELVRIFGSSKIEVVDQHVGDDMWIQDEVEIGFTNWPGPLSGYNNIIAQVLNLPRENDYLDQWPKDKLLGPSYGTFEVGSDEGGYNHGGNIEVSAPTPNYPWGRVVIGSVDDQDILDFLTAQIYQPYIMFDTTWLLVGHIDEVISFIPYSGGVKVLIAESTSTLNTLQGMNTEDTGTATEATATSLTDNNKQWTANDWTGGFVKITLGTGLNQVRQIGSNTATLINVTRNWSTTPDDTSQYELTSRSAYRAMYFEGAEDCGVVTSATINSITDETKNWTPGCWAGGAVIVTDIDGYLDDRVRIASNTENTLNLQSNLDEIPGDNIRYIVVETPKLKDQEPGVPDEAVPPWSVHVRAYCKPARAAYFTEVQDNIEIIKISLGLELGLSPSDFIKIPAIFAPKIRNGNVYFYHSMPGVVNSLIADNVIVVPKPFGPRNNAGLDVFEEQVISTLAGSNLSVEFVDDWDYHKLFGEIHCGTNVLRKPSPSDIPWW
jgi:hypothetical protein